MLKRTRSICASKNTYVEILLCLYRECFAMIKNDTFGNSLIQKSERKDLVLFYNLFSVLIVIVDACLSRWKDVSFFWNTKRKLLLWTKWTYDSDLVSESHVEFLCYWDRLGCLYCVGMSACCRPLSILSVACALAPT